MRLHFSTGPVLNLAWRECEWRRPGVGKPTNTCNSEPRTHSTTSSPPRQHSPFVFPVWRERQCHLVSARSYMTKTRRVLTPRQARSTFARRKDADGESASKGKATACEASAPEAKTGEEDDDLDSFFAQANAQVAACIQNQDYVSLGGGAHANARQAVAGAPCCTGRGNMVLAGIVGAAARDNCKPH